MKSYKSARIVNPSDTLTFAFDVSSDKMLMQIGLCDSKGFQPATLTINTNVNDGLISEIIENNINDNPNHQNNTFCGEHVIIEANEQDSGIKVGDSLESLNLIQIDEDNNYVFENVSQNASLENAENGSLIFFLTDSPKTEEYISSDLGFYEQREKDAHEITPLILCHEYNYPIMENYDDDFISFIELGHQVTRDYSASPTTIYTTVINSSDGISFTKEYQSIEDILTSSYRARFVISNNGRMISFSVFNKEKLVWENVKSIICNIPKLNGEYHLVFSVDKPTNIRNITANF